MDWICEGVKRIDNNLTRIYSLLTSNTTALFRVSENVPEVRIMRIVDGKWVESRYFGDEPGMLLPLGTVEMLQGYVTAPWTSWGVTYEHRS